MEETTELTTSLIELRQLPVIEERLRLVKEQIEEQTETAMNVVCTEETYKDVKNVRANLNHEFAELEDQRKAIKRQILEPYESFEEVYKECVAEPFEKADEALKAKIGDVENSLKDSKETEAKAYYAELAQKQGIEWLSWERVREHLKIGVSTSQKNIIKQIETFVAPIVYNAKALQGLANADEVLVEYKDCLNAAEAMRRVEERNKALEEERAIRELQKQQDEWSQKHAEEIKRGIEGSQAHPLRAPVREQKVYACTFTVKATKDKLKILKNFLESEGYDYASK